MAESGHWMEHLNIRKNGLHKALGVSTDKKIPASKLQSARVSRNPRIKRMATLAETFAKARG